MGYTAAGLDQTLPIPELLDAFFRNREVTRRNLAPKALPASVVKVDATGTIVTVKFEVLEPGTNPSMQDIHPYYVLKFPQTEMPVATDLYGIPPLQVGDFGYCLPSDVDLGAVAGYYSGPASLTVQPNLSTLAFHPIGSTKAQNRPDASKYWINGPNGVILQSLGDIPTIVEIGPTQDGPTNAMKITPLINASSDMQARQLGVPQFGLYHNNGTVKYQYTVP